tara:strand:- start:135 stop:578 length:444 start_codon:yes stop_codon:yes gene_type:complete
MKSQLKYLVIAAVYVTENKAELSEKLKSLKGCWDVINIDGSLTKIKNGIVKDDVFYSDDFIRLAYIKPLKHNALDNRSAKQVDSMEAYIKYHLLINPYTYIADVSIFTEDLEVGFDIETISSEYGIHKRNIMVACTEFKIPPYEESR